MKIHKILFLDMLAQVLEKSPAEVQSKKKKTSRDRGLVHTYQNNLFSSVFFGIVSSIFASIRIH